MSEADIDLASVLDAMRKSARVTASGTKAAMMARDTVALACKKTPIVAAGLAIISTNVTSSLPRESVKTAHAKKLAHLAFFQPVRLRDKPSDNCSEHIPAKFPYQSTTPHSL